MAVNIFAQGMDAFDQSWDRTQGFFDKNTARRAGRALAGGDRKAAMQEFGNAGQVDAVRALEGDQRRADDTAYERQRDEQADQRQGQQDQIRAAENLLEASSLLSKVPQEQRWQVFTGHPLFQTLIPEEMRAQVRPEHLSDEGLAMFASEVKSQMVNLGGGGVAEYTPGQPLKVLREPDKPIVLGNGAVAFGPDGSVIARNPKTYAPPRPGGGGSGLPPPPTGWRPR